MNRLKLLAAAMLLAVPIACGDEVLPPPPTGSIDGLVSIEGQGIDAVSVTLSNGASAITANGGMYRFDGVEAGAYTVTISNYPDDASFNQTSAAATIATDGQNVTVNFPGTYIRTSSIMGTVTVENEGLGGVTVKLSGVSDSETLTDAGGQYAFTGLRAGNYTVEITGFDDEDVAFGSTSSAATVATGESKVVSFEGTYLRTSGIVGQVTADEEPQEGIAVSLQGRGESRTVSTNGAGQFSFEQLRRGDYSVVISGYDTDEMTFDVTSQSVTVAYGETANVPFEGTLLRTAGIAGTVTVEGVGPIANVTVTINGEGETLERTTDHMGAYAFGGLHAGDYSVAISGFDDDEYGFPDGTSATVTVELQETGTVPFDGIMLRTAAIEGTVTVGDDDAPLPGVMVTVSGGPRDEEHATTTNNDGMYMVENLHAGTYSVTISGYDTREYGFDPTTRTLTVDLRDTGEAAFQGELLRTAGVSGRVHVGGMGLPGVTVKLTGEESREGNTNADGQYAFAGLAAGDYTLTISGWDEVEYHFEPTMEITLELDETRTGQNFAGRALRTATVMGYVTVEGDALPDITVALLQFTGENTIEVLDDVMTDADGAYAFGPLLAGAYLVSIVEGYTDEHEFAEMESFVAVETDGTATVNFAATIIRTAGVSGKVEVEGEALADVEVTLTGEHAPEDNTMETGDDGMYEFGGLRKGDYTVSITKLPNADAYNFPSMSQPVNLSVGQDQPGISFAGELVRSAGVSGRVHVDGNGLAGVTVTLDGPDSHNPETTDANGQYGFSGLAAGDYTVTISGWDEVEYAFEPTMEISLELDESMSGVNFAGRALRTATVMGYVTVEGDALPGVAVTLLKVTGTSSGDVLGTKATDEDGGYSFGPLLAGAYQVRIAGYADEHDFADGTTQTTAVDTDGTASVNFAATIIRTAGVSGMVTVDGEAMADVEVTLAGDHAPEDNTMTTGADGGYSFGGLRKGDYTVSIENPDADAYSFPSMSQSLNLSVGQEQTGISFAGAQLRQASISGQVHAEGDPVEGVMVTLSGDADDAVVTDNNGEYNFPSLAGGDYMVTIAGWDEAAYEFASAEAAVEGLGSDEFKIVDFAGTHTRTAMVKGKLFIDEGPDEGVYHSSEPMLDKAAWADYLPEDLVPPFVTGVPVALHGPELDSVQYGMADVDGNYMFDELVKGDYLVRVALTVMNPLDPTGDPIDVGALLGLAGYKLGGENNDVGVPVNVTAGGKSEVDFPFMITKQTINVGAVMGYPSDGIAADDRTKVEGVTLTLYATAEDANAQENALGTMPTGAMGSDDMPNPNHGVATFEFEREKDKGPGGQGNDHLVFAKVVVDEDDDLQLADNRAIEIQYPATARESDARAAARLVNVRANFQWRVTRNADSKDGADENGDPHRLGGWHVLVGRGDATHTTHTTADSADMGVDADDHGKATVSVRIETERIDESVIDAYDGIEVMIDVDVSQPDGDERWEQSDALSYTHNFLALPADNTSEMNDLGNIYVTWTTQSLTLGVYREADDVQYFTDFRSELASGDVRPHEDVGADMEVELLTRDSRDRLRLYDEWDHDCDGEDDDPSEPEDAKGNFAAGTFTFNCLPAGEEFTVRYKPGAGRVQMDYRYDEIETFGDDLDFGVSVGAFGAMSGAGPEVRMCSASDATNADATSDDWCATFAYQWNTGTVGGTVGSESGHKVDVQPETTVHGAIGDETTTARDGSYSIGGLQDGVYTAEAASGDDDYRILGDAEEDGIALYHNEACWADPDPDNDDCDEDDELVVDEIDEDDDTTWAYTNEYPKSWGTDRLNLAIRGYVANDGQDGEQLDGLLRGDESRAGVTVTLKKGAVTEATTVTNPSGDYEFDGLDAGSYTVVAGRGSNYRAIHAIARRTTGTRAWRYVDFKTATAEDYTLTPDEADLPKPFWNRANTAGGTMGNDEVTVTGTGTNPASDKYYNFALVYTDGELSGSVNNLSGSNASASIDIIISTPSPLDDDEKVETDSRGNFELGGLIEAMDYTAVIEDAGFEAPCMGTGGTPDDDLEADDGTCGQDDNGVDRSRFPTELTADIEGESDHESMGTLTVYNDRLSDADEMTAIEVEGQTAVGGDDVDLGDGVTIDLQGTDPTTAITLGLTDPITFFSTSVTVDADISPGASMVVMKGAVVCARGVCELDYNATDGDDPGGTPPDTEITVMVIAENGYNDHDYIFSVSRANPVDHTLEGLDVVDGDDATTDDVTGSDGATTQWTHSIGAAVTSVELVFDFKTLAYGAGDDVGDVAWCQTATVSDGGTTVTAEAKENDDECAGMRFEVDAPAAGQAKTLTLKVRAEDDPTERTVSLTINRPSS